MSEYLNYEIINNNFYVRFLKPYTEIDFYNTKELSDIFNKALELNYRVIYMDCKNLSYIDSSGINTLYQYTKQIKMILLHLDDNIKKVLEYTNLLSYFQIEN